ncbi:MAG: outer membrane protein [Limnohabitans sp.]
MTACAALVCLSQTPAMAEQEEFSFYGGIQESPHSTVKIGEERIGAGWEGKSFSSPPYYGLRYTRWLDDQTGWSINYAHAKAYSNDKTRTKYEYKVLEFTDGVNPITVNYLRKFEPVSGWTPYAGVGIGFAVPHVEVQKDTRDAVKTSEFQFGGGPVFRFSMGGNRPINDKWGWFVEYDFHYVMLDVKHKNEPVKTNLIHNALNVGLNYRF